MAEKKFLTSVSVNATDNCKVLSGNIAEARKVRKFSQRELASRCLMSLATYQAIENANLTFSFGAVLNVLELTHTLRDVAGNHPLIRHLCLFRPVV